jgi:hypothetical protein
MAKWILFTYRVPSEPSARRVYVWRKLRGLGALLLHDAVWVLPATDQTREKLVWLAAEVCEMDGGNAAVWEAAQIFTGADTDLIAQFNALVDAGYRELLEALAEPGADLTALARRYQQIRRGDYFQSVLGEEVRRILVERRDGGVT